MDNPGVNCLADLTHELSARGYLTPAIQNFINSLNGQLSGKLLSQKEVADHLIALSQDRNEALPGFYMLSLLWTSFPFSDQISQTIGKNIYKFLADYYDQKLLLNEYNINTRFVAWHLLLNLKPKLEENFQKEIDDLVAKVSQMPKEDGFLKVQITSSRKE